MRIDPNEQLKFSTSSSVRAYLDCLAKKGLYGSTRSSVIDQIVRQAIITMSQSANPPVTDAEVRMALLSGEPKPATESPPNAHAA
jgi:hypothetical protein